MDIEQKKKTDALLYKSRFKIEAEKIPTEILLDNEKILVQKCIDQEPISDEEMAELKRILHNYRAVISEYDTETIEENIEKTQRVIKSERELLKLIDSQQKMKLKMKYHVGEEDVILDLIVKPLTDSQTIYEMQNHLDLFRECSPSERTILTKISAGNVISEEEARMIEHLNNRIEDKIFNSENIVRGQIEFLARQVEFENCDITKLEDKIAFWEKIKLSYRVALYNKVRHLLHLEDTDDEDLFLDD